MTAHVLLETRGLVAAVAAADAMGKAADVAFEPRQLVGDGLVTVVATGPVAAVRVAAHAGELAAAAVGEVVGIHVIARPFTDIVAPSTPARAPEPTRTQGTDTDDSPTEKPPASPKTSSTRSPKGSVHEEDSNG